MPDMIVNLVDLPQYDETPAKKANIKIFRPIAPDKKYICDFVKELSTPAASNECDVCFSRVPTSCFVALKDGEVVGYACYNAIAPGFFGPTAVKKECRGLGIGKMLLLRCMQALRDEGHVYGIIGGVGPADFYVKCVNAKIIENSTPGIYADFLNKK